MNPRTRSLLPSALRSWLLRRSLMKRHGLAHVPYDVRGIIQNARFGRACRVGRDVLLRHVTMGDYSYVEAGCRITGTRIGKYCSIAPNVTIGLASHPLGKAASTHPRFFRDAPEFGYDLTNRELHTEYNETTIGHDVWVGANAVIKDGVTVGNGAVIGAGAVVVRDVGPYAIVGGVPAKVIRQRFDDSTVERLQHLAWWDQDDEWLRRHLDKMLDVTQLIELSDAASAASLDHQA